MKNRREVRVMENECSLLLKEARVDFGEPPQNLLPARADLWDWRKGENMRRLRNMRNAMAWMDGFTEVDGFQDVWADWYRYMRVKQSRGNHWVKHTALKREAFV